MKIVFLDQYSVSDADLTPIKECGDYIGYDYTYPDQVVERCQGAEVVISNKVVIGADEMDQLPQLRLICVAATGMNNIDLNAAAERGVEVRNAVGYSTHSVAEATLGGVLTMLRQVTYFDRYIKSGEYSRAERLFCFDRKIGQLKGSNWGIIGLGAIGREVARLADSFGCQTRYFSASGTAREESVVCVESLKELLEWSDIVSIHSPLNEQTVGLIGESEFESMRSNAILVNVARGGIVNEVALRDALNRDLISGAVVDVFVAEPIVANSPILEVEQSDRLLLSPHNAWASELSIQSLMPRKIL